MKKVKNGFTLVELLVVLAILAAVSLLVVPQVLKIIDNSKKESFRTSVYGIIRSVQQNYSDELNYNMGNGLFYIIEDGILYLYNPENQKQSIPYNGNLKKAEGEIRVTSNEKIYVTIDYDKWCAIKKYKSDEVDVYSIKEKEKCHDELINPTLHLNAIIYDTGETYISDTWIDKNVVLYAITNSTDTSNYKYTWYKDNIKIKDVDSSVLTVYNSSVNSTYKYSITNSEGKEIFSSNEIKVKIDKNTPNCTINLSGTKGNNGWYTDYVSATLDTGYSISGITKYGMSSSSTASYNNVKDLIITGNGNFEINGIVENALGKVGTCYINLKKDTTNEISVSITGIIESNNQVYTSGSEVTSNVILNGNVMPQTTVSGYKYQWYKNGKKISDANSLQYKVTTSGEYYLLVEAGNGVKNTSNKIDVNIATERPTCNINVENGTSGLNGWYTSDVTVSLSKQSAVKYGMSIISNYEYNGITSLDLINSSTVYCFVSDSTGVKTNSNSKDIKIDKEAPIIDDFTGTKITDSSNNISYILTVSATDNGSGIDYYEFYGYNATYNLEDELGISENNTIKITGFKNGYTYKVKVYDLAGNVSEETLYESCKLETEGTCTSGTQIDTYKCDPTGRTYNVPKSCSNYSGGPSSGTGSSSCCSSVGSACKSSCSNYTDSTEKADCNARCDAQQSECAAQNAANGLC